MGTKTDDGPSYEQRIRRDFGHKLADMRHDRGLTQMEVALRMDISQSSIQALETARQNVTMVQMFNLAVALGCGPLDLWPDA